MNKCQFLPNEKHKGIVARKIMELFNEISTIYSQKSASLSKKTLMADEAKVRKLKELVQELNGEQSPFYNSKTLRSNILSVMGELFKHPLYRSYALLFKEFNENYLNEVLSNKRVIPEQPNPDIQAILDKEGVATSPNEVRLSFWKSYFGTHTDLKGYVAKQIDLGIVSAFALDRKAKIITNGSDLISGVHRLQEQYWSDILNYLANSPSKAILEELKLKAKKQKINLEKLFVDGKPTGAYEFLINSKDLEMTLSQFASPERLHEIYRDFMNGNPDSLAMKAITAMIALTHFDSLVSMNLGKSVVIQCDFNQLSGDPYKYRFSERGDANNTNWRTTDEVFLSKEVSKFTQRLIETTPLLNWNSNGTITESGSYLRFLDFANIITKLKEISYNPSFRFAFTDVDAGLPVNVINKIKSRGFHISKQTEALMRLNSSLSEMVSKIRLDSQLYLPAVIELLTLQNQKGERLIETSFVQSTNLSRLFGETEKNVLMSIHKGITSFPDVDPDGDLFNDSINAIESHFESNSDFFSSVCLVADSMFKVTHLEYFEDDDGTIKIRALRDKGVDDKSRIFLYQVKERNGKTISKLTLAPQVEKYQVQCNGVLLHNDEENFINQLKENKNISFIFNVDSKNLFELSISISDRSVKITPIKSTPQYFNNGNLTLDFFKSNIFNEFIIDKLGIQLGAGCDYDFVNAMNFGEQNSPEKNQLDNRKTLLDLASIAFLNQIISNKILDSDFRNKAIEFYGDSVPNLGLTEILMFGRLDVPKINKVAKWKYIASRATDIGTVKGADGETYSSQTLSRLIDGLPIQFDLQNRRPGSATINCSLIANLNLYKGCYVAQDFKGKTNNKTHTKFTVAEGIIATFVQDFIGGLTDRESYYRSPFKNGTVGFLSSVNSDKSQITRIAIDLTERLSCNDKLKEELAKIGINFDSNLNVIDIIRRDDARIILSRAICLELGEIYSKIKSKAESDLNVLYNASGFEFKRTININGRESEVNVRKIQDNVYAIEESGEGIWGASVDLNTDEIEFYGTVGIDLPIAFEKELATFVTPVASDIVSEFIEYDNLSIYDKFNKLGGKKAIERMCAIYNANHRQNPITLTDQVHYVADKKTGNISMNKTFEELIKRYSNPDEFESFLKIKEAEIVKSLCDANFELILDETSLEHLYLLGRKLIDSKSKTYDFPEANDWISDSGAMVIALIEVPVIENGKVTNKTLVLKIYNSYSFSQAENKIRQVLKKGRSWSLSKNIQEIHKFGFKLNPMLVKYNLLDYLFTQEFMISSVGSHIAHPGKGNFYTQTKTETSGYKHNNYYQDIPRNEAGLVKNPIEMTPEELLKFEIPAYYEGKFRPQSFPNFGRKSVEENGHEVIYGITEVINTEEGLIFTVRKYDKTDRNSEIFEVKNNGVGTLIRQKGQEGWTNSSGFLFSFFSNMELDHFKNISGTSFKVCQDLYDRFGIRTKFGNRIYEFTDRLQNAMRYKALRGGMIFENYPGDNTNALRNAGFFATEDNPITSGTNDLMSENPEVVLIQRSNLEHNLNESTKSLIDDAIEQGVEFIVENDPILIEYLNQLVTLEKNVKYTIYSSSLKPVLLPENFIKSNIVKSEKTYNPLAEEAARFYAQHKRNVSFTASMLEFKLGEIKGIPTEYNIAIMRDIKQNVATITGVQDDHAPFDGATFVNPFVVLLENNSLLGAKAGVDKKQFVHFYNEALGHGGIIKTAGFGVTNDRIRNSEDFYKVMMYNMTHYKWIGQNGNPWVVDFTSNDNRRVNTQASYFNDIYFLRGNKYFARELKSNVGNNTYSYDEYQVDEQGIEIEGTRVENTVVLDNNYSLWEFFGGEFACELNDSGFEYSENSIERVVDLMNDFVESTGLGNGTTQTSFYQPMKHSDIHYMPTEGAVKQGAANFNDSEMFKKRDGEDGLINFYKIRMLQAGIQLDKEHHADESELSMMTQVISACTSMGYTPQYATNMYNALKSLTLNGIKQLRNGWLELFDIQEDSDFDLAIAEVVIKGILKSREQEGDILQIIASDLIDAAKRGELNFKDDIIPYSNPQIFAKLTSLIASSMTNKGIKVKMKGILSVLCPTLLSFKLYGGRKLESFERSDDGSGNFTTEKALNNLQEVYDANCIIGDSNYTSDDECVYVKVSEIISSDNDTTDGREVSWDEERNSVKIYLKGKEELGYILVKESGHLLKIQENFINDISPENKQLLYSKATQFIAPGGRIELNEGQEIIQEGFGIDESGLFGRMNPDAPFVEEQDFGAKLNLDKSKFKTIGVDGIANIELGHTYRITTNEGTFEKLIDNFDELDELIEIIKNNINNPGFRVSEYIKEGTDLDHYNVRFTAVANEENTLPIELQRNNFSIYDLDSVRNNFKIKKINKKIQSELENDDVDLDSLREKVSELSNFIYDVLGGVSYLERLSGMYPQYDFTSYPNAELLTNFLVNLDNKSILKNILYDSLRLLNYIQQLELKSISPSRTEAVTVTINGQKMTVDKQSIKTKAYLAIMPKIFASEFGLRKYDNLKEIAENKDFFKNRILENFSIKVVNGLAYDVALKRINGNHVYIKTKSSFDLNKDDINYTIKKMLPPFVDDTTGKVYEVDTNGNKIRELSSENDQIILDGLGNEIIVTDNYQFYVDHESYNSIELSPRTLQQNPDFGLDFLEKCQESLNYSAKKWYRYINTFEGNTVSEKLNLYNTTLHRNPNDPRILAQIDELSRAIHSSFLKSLEIVASRIPAQSQQSFMPMEVVAFDNPNINTAYVSLLQFYMQGSDLDIDAVSLAAFEMNKNGQFVEWSNLFDMSTKDALDSSCKLPFPTSVELEMKFPTLENPNFLYKYSDLISRITTTRLYVKNGNFETRTTIEIPTEYLIEFGDFIREVNKNGFIVGLSDREALSQAGISNVDEVLEQLLKTINNHNLFLSKKSKSFIELAVKNYNMQQMYDIINDPVNLMEALTPIDVATGPFKSLANQSEDAEELKTFTPGNVFNKIQAIVENQVGKEDVAISATALKLFFATTYVLNDILENGTLEERAAIKFDVLINGKHYNTFANIKSRLRREDDEIQQLLDLTEENSDAAVDLAAMLSLAVDNAKDLCLAKINAGTGMIGMYLYGLSIGVPFRELYNIINSPVGRMISRLMNGNIFTKLNSESLQSALDYYRIGPKKQLVKFMTNEYSVGSSLERVFIESNYWREPEKPREEDFDGDDREYQEALKAYNFIREHNLKVAQGNYGRFGATWAHVPDGGGVDGETQRFEIGGKHNLRSRDGALTMTCDLHLILQQLSRHKMELSDKLAIINSIQTVKLKDMNKSNDSYKTNILMFEFIKQWLSEADIINGWRREGSELKHNKGYWKYRDLENLSAGAEVTKLLGLMLSVNKGVKTSHSDLLGQVGNVQQAYIRVAQVRENQFSRTLPWIPRLHVGNEHKIDFTQFFTPKTDGNGNVIKDSMGNEKLSDYALDQIKKFSKLTRPLEVDEEGNELPFSKKRNAVAAVNILNIIAKCPLYNGYFLTVLMTYESLKRKSGKFRSVETLSERALDLLGVRGKNNEDAVRRSITNLVDRKLINMWLMTQPMINLKSKTPFVRYKYSVNDDNGIELHQDYETEVNISLGTPESNATFKRYIEEVYIPALKKAFPTNKFLQALDYTTYGKTTTRNQIIAMTLPINMSPKADTVEEDIFIEYKDSFNQLDSAKLPDNTLGVKIAKIPITRMLYLYNLITFGGKSGQNSLSNIFKDILNNETCKSFNSFIRSFDLDSLFIPSKDDNGIETGGSISDSELVLACAIQGSVFGNNGRVVWDKNPETGIITLYQKSSKDAILNRKTKGLDLSEEDYENIYNAVVRTYSRTNYYTEQSTGNTIDYNHFTDLSLNEDFKTFKVEIGGKSHVIEANIKSKEVNGQTIFDPVISNIILTDDVVIDGTTIPKKEAIKILKGARLKIVQTTRSVLIDGKKLIIKDVNFDSKSIEKLLQQKLNCG